METGRVREREQVVRVGCEDPVAVGSEENERRVDDVATSRSAQQYAGTPAQGIIEGRDDEPREQASQRSLTARAAPPDLAHDATVRDWRAAPE
ncbi:MAG: hypothetical protein L0H73_06855 [Nitrococcus sp.]|nr:hypothetical protein [Nitrococcus sp.]